MLTPQIKAEDWTSVRTAINKLKNRLGPNASPTFAGVTLTGLTATRLVQSDGNKALISVATLSSWIAGTTNQVTVTDDGDGTVTLALPQDIHTGASPTFAGLTINGVTLINVSSASAFIVEDSGTYDNFVRIDTSTPAFLINKAAPEAGYSIDMLGMPGIDSSSPTFGLAVRLKGGRSGNQTGSSGTGAQGILCIFEGGDPGDAIADGGSGDYTGGLGGAGVVAGTTGGNATLSTFGIKTGGKGGPAIVIAGRGGEADGESRHITGDGGDVYLISGLYGATGVGSTAGDIGQIFIDMEGFVGITGVRVARWDTSKNFRVYNKMKVGADGVPSEDLDVEANGVFGGSVMCASLTIDNTGATDAVLTMDGSSNSAGTLTYESDNNRFIWDKPHTITGSILINQADDTDGIKIVGFDNESDVSINMRISQYGVAKVDVTGELAFQTSGGTGNNLAFRSVGNLIFKVTHASANKSIQFHDSGNVVLLDMTENGILKIGGVVAGNYTEISATGDLVFVGSAGFYPRFLTQANEPAVGTGPTQCDTSETVIWKDSDDSKVYLCFNDGGTVKIVELI